MVKTLASPSGAIWTVFPAPQILPKTADFTKSFLKTLFSFFTVWPPPKLYYLGSPFIYRLTEPSKMTSKREDLPCVNDTTKLCISSQAGIFLRFLINGWFHPRKPNMLTRFRPRRLRESPAQYREHREKSQCFVIVCEITHSVLTEWGTTARNVNDRTSSQADWSRTRLYFSIQLSATASSRTVFFRPRSCRYFSAGRITPL